MNEKISLWGKLAGGATAIVSVVYFLFGIPVFADAADGKVEGYTGSAYKWVEKLTAESDTATQEECEDDCSIAFVTTAD